ncbi:MAG: ribose 5-phosphate isomerase B [Deltaproteobacteria bacterium]|jgi:ribose 5-phosphate isomerase B|nr:ribose 5-phosphate isomerase B [Deltaproteobacteria bacterium]
MARIVIGADHAGLEFKTFLSARIKDLGHFLEDVGAAPGTERADYPLIAREAARAILSGRFDLGVLVCGTGIGMAVAANRFSGIRAAVCENEVSARFSRTHNDANILCLGARIIGPELALSVTEVFLAHSFLGGRHRERVRMIDPPEGAV